MRRGPFQGEDWGGADRPGCVRAPNLSRLTKDRPAPPGDGAGRVLTAALVAVNI